MTHRLHITEPRCLAHPSGNTKAGRPLSWCAMRETCARALAIRSDRFDVTPPTSFRVCADGGYDHFIEAQP